MQQPILSSQRLLQQEVDLRGEEIMWGLLLYLPNDYLPLHILGAIPSHFPHNDTMQYIISFTLLFYYSYWYMVMFLLLLLLNNFVCMDTSYGSLNILIRNGAKNENNIGIRFTPLQTGKKKSNDEQILD